MIGWSIAKRWEAAAATGEERSHMLCWGLSLLWSIVWCGLQSIKISFFCWYRWMMNGWLCVDNDGGKWLLGQHIFCCCIMQPPLLSSCYKLSSLFQSNHVCHTNTILPYSLDDIDMHCCNQYNIFLAIWHHRLQITIALHHITQHIIKLLSSHRSTKFNKTNYASYQYCPSAACHYRHWVSAIPAE